MLDYSVCCIKECDKESHALGLCINHYRLNKKYGSPVVMERHSGHFHGKPADERFAMQVKAQPNGCLHWIGGRDQDGYGCMRGEAAGQMHYRAHRWSWSFHNDRPIPPRGHICHTCDDPRCVNPDHLFLGDALINMQDKIAKGRQRAPAGSENGKALITEEQAQAILRDPRTYTQIAADYNVRPSTIGSIKQRVSWKALGDVDVARHERVSPRKGVSDRITPDIVRDIRTKQISGKEYAEKYGITRASVCDIQKRRSWAHVE
jgi:hypothetical protein